MQNDLIRSKYAPLIKIISEDIEKKANKKLADAGITLSQSQVLVCLYHKDKCECSLKELEKLFHVSQATVAGIVSRMEAKGFVRRYLNKGDKRSKNVVLTDTGKEIAKKSMEALNEIENRFLSCLEEDEKSQLLLLLNKVCEDLLNNDSTFAN